MRRQYRSHATHWVETNSHGPALVELQSEYAPVYFEHVSATEAYLKVGALVVRLQSATPITVRVDDTAMALAADETRGDLRRRAAREESA